jgi:hypothetical protein
MIRTILFSITSLFLLASSALAHHSAVAFFDEENMGEIEGVVTSTRWRNPHVAFEVTVTGVDGQNIVWSVESNSLNALERIGLSPDTVAVGDQLQFWGPLSKQGLPSMRAYNVLLSNREEILMMPHVSTERHWAANKLAVAVPVLQNKDVSESVELADGIFRVWTQGRISLVNSELPLTQEAMAEKAAYDPLIDDPVLRCIPTGMPAVMDVTFPIEFIAQEDDIVLHLEQWDTVRTIHMTEGAVSPSGQSATREGYSKGRWESGVLVVETSNIDWMFFDDRGTPLSSAVSVIERFTLSVDQKELHWQATTMDPATFTEPVIQEQTFSWVPGERIRPYECATAGGVLN